MNTLFLIIFTTVAKIFFGTIAIILGLYVSLSLIGLVGKLVEKLSKLFTKKK